MGVLQVCSIRTPAGVSTDPAGKGSVTQNCAPLPMPIATTVVSISALSVARLVRGQEAEGPPRDESSEGQLQANFTSRRTRRSPPFISSSWRFYHLTPAPREESEYGTKRGLEREQSHHGHTAPVAGRACRALLHFAESTARSFPVGGVRPPAMVHVPWPRFPKGVWSLRVLRVAFG